MRTIVAFLLVGFAGIFLGAALVLHLTFWQSGTPGETRDTMPVEFV